MDAHLALCHAEHATAAPTPCADCGEPWQGNITCEGLPICDECHTAQLEADRWFARLARKLATTGLDSGTVRGGYRVGVDADEFMLMQVSTPGREGYRLAAFKHRASRNYLHLHWIDAADDGRIEVPIGGAFYGGTFPATASLSASV